MFSKLILLARVFLESVLASPMCGCKERRLFASAPAELLNICVEAELLRKCVQGIVQVRDFDDAWRHRALKDSFPVLLLILISSLSWISRVLEAGFRITL